MSSVGYTEAVIFAVASLLYVGISLLLLLRQGVRGLAYALCIPILTSFSVNALQFIEVSIANVKIGTDLSLAAQSAGLGIAEELLRAVVLIGLTTSINNEPKRLGISISVATSYALIENVTTLFPLYARGAAVVLLLMYSAHNEPTIAAPLTVPGSPAWISVAFFSAIQFTRLLIHGSLLLLSTSTLRRRMWKSFAIVVICHGSINFGLQSFAGAGNVIEPAFLFGLHLIAITALATLSVVAFPQSRAIILGVLRKVIPPWRRPPAPHLSRQPSLDSDHE